MDTQDATKLKAPVLGQFLLMQSILCCLPDEQSIFSFVCRGLRDVPGVIDVIHLVDPAGGAEDAAQFRLSLRAERTSWGDLLVTVSDWGAFGPYESYLRNFALMVAVILQERHQRRLNEEHQLHLEDRVKERTRQLQAEVAERREVEEELRRSRNMLAHTLDSIPQAVFWKDGEGRYLGCNRGFAQLAGVARPEHIFGKSDFDLPWPRADSDAYREVDRSVIERREPRRHLEEPMQGIDGIRRWIETTKVPLTDENGHVYGVLGVFDDITERKGAERERERLQGELLQVQKMDSIGRLAGGVAHDFNNMLQVILGYTELARQEQPGSTRYRESLDEIRKAARRSADLTRQLLAFARKQAVSPKVLDLNETVANMLKMLRRLLGEDIQLEWHPGPSLWKVWVDPVQIDQLLANLTVNARDAIGGSGQITIETANVTLDASCTMLSPEAKPGDYVTLTVRDTGCGIDLETQQKMFEPFFTTKGVGHGTGLGLAMTYGIVTQNLGFITVQSAPGQGSTFTTHLPRSMRRAESDTSSSDEPTRGGAETILLVEDEELVLELSCQLLEQQGYTVLAARLPEDALEIAARFEGAIQLMITDVVMPGINGRDLHARVAAIRPGMRCLYISGYAAEILARQGVLADHVQLLRKPFSAAQLTRKVRQLLEASALGRSSVHASSPG